MTGFTEIHPDPGAYDHYPNPTEQERRHVAHKVAGLLGRDSLYLRGTLVPELACLSSFAFKPFADLFLGPTRSVRAPGGARIYPHSVFCKKSSREPLAALDLDAFDPLPLPLMAYACTAVCMNSLRLSSEFDVPSIAPTRP